jgi:signal transduction histidine kinase
MKYIIIFFLLVFNGTAFAQEKISKQDSDLYKALIKELNTGNHEAGLRKTDSIYALAIKTNNKLLEILLLGILTTRDLQNGSYKASEENNLKQYKVISSLKDSYLKDSLFVKNLNKNGDLYRDQGSYPEAAVKFNEALVIAKKINDTILMSKTYYFLGNVYAEQALYDDALFYYGLCTQTNRSLELKNSINSNIGFIYMYKNEYKKAEEYLNETLRNTDSIDIYNLSKIYTGLGSLNTKMEKYKKAHVFFLKADKYTSLLNNGNYQLTNKINLITSFINIGDYNSANILSKKCDSLARNIDSYSLKRHLYNTLYANYARIKDYKSAFESVEKFMIASDSLFNIEKLKTVKDLKIKYESDIKESEILTQQQLISTQKRNNNWLVSGLVTLIGLLGLSIFLYRQRLRTQQELLKKQEELSIANIANLIETQKVKSYESHLKGQNKERERIAKDLHDSVSGNLAAIKIKLTGIQLEHSKEMDTIIKSLDTTYNEVRTISHDLLPQGNIEQRFIDNINQLILLYDSKDITFSLDVFPEEELNNLPQVMQVEVYRILQEVITNIVKHANATRTNINITLHDDYLNIIVEDNGIGYDTNSKSQGIGLRNITSRISSLIGTLDIDSIEGKGTTVNINFPVK